MNDSAESRNLVRGAQVIAGAMIGGVLFFAAISVVLAGGVGVESDGELLSTILAGLSVPPLLLFLFLPVSIIEQLLEKQLRSRSTSVVGNNKPYQTMQLATIVRFAFLEGGAFMNLIAYIVEHNLWSLGIVGVFILFMLSNFPTETRFKHYAEAQQTFS